MLPGKKAAKFMPTDIDRGFYAATPRGAKRGGLTDHIAGPHLIPNVGREAMVPAEVVCRRQRPAPKKPPPEPPKPKVLPSKKHSSKRLRHRSRERSRGRSRDPKDRHGRSSSSASEDREEPEDDVALRKKEEQERRRKEEMDREAEARFAHEQAKLKELEEVRQKKEEIQSQRRQKLSGLFALTEDDIEAEESEEAKKARIAREKARAERKAGDRPDAARVGYATPAAAASASDHASNMLAEGVTGNLTAADIDGRMHDHKFSKVWKDWDSAKKSDPGEVARQFMKIAAIKRRGYAPKGDGRGGMDTGRSRSRSPPPRGRYR